MGFLCGSAFIAFVVFLILFIVRAAKKKKFKTQLIICAACLVAGIICACASGSNSSGTDSVISTTVAPVVEEVEYSEPETTDEEVVVETIIEESTPAPEDDSLVVGDCKIETIGPTILESDYKGNDVYVLPVTWTNVGDEPVAFAYEVTLHIYQNGVECEECYFLEDSDDYDSLSSLNEVRPGATYTIYYIFYADPGTELEIGIEPWISFDNTDEVIVTLSIE